MADIIKFNPKKIIKPDERSPKERVLDCANGTCKNCPYCIYRKESSQMIVDFLGEDLYVFQKNNNLQISYWDMKEILLGALEHVKKIEQGILNDK